MKLGYTIIYVADVVATIAFYERAFGLQRSFVHESGMYGELATGETVLAFAAEPMAEANGLSIRPNRPTEAPAGFEIALVTDARSALMRRPSRPVPRRSARLPQSPGASWWVTC